MRPGSPAALPPKHESVNEVGRYRKQRQSPKQHCNHRGRLCHSCLQAGCGADPDGAVLESERDGALAQRDRPTVGGGRPRGAKSSTTFWDKEEGGGVNKNTGALDSESMWTTPAPASPRTPQTY